MTKDVGNNIYSTRLKKFLASYEGHKIQGYLLTSTDRYQNKYLSDKNNQIKYLTGFSGSFAYVIILANKGFFITDGRYTAQARMQLDTNFYEIINIKNLSEFNWGEYIGADFSIGYDPLICTKSILLSFKEYKFIPIQSPLISIAVNPENFSRFTGAYLYPLEYVGDSWQKKVALVRESIQADEHILLSSSESICWMLNIRGRDQEFCPILNCFALISSQEVLVFTQLEKIGEDLRSEFKGSVTFLSEELIEAYLAEINSKILFDTNKCALYFVESIGTRAAHMQDPCLIHRAKKTDVEINWAIKRHVEDAVAMCEFFSYLEQQLQHNQSIDEFILGEEISAFRRRSPGYISDSFDSICGYQENSAIIHYRASRETSKPIIHKGILLIDSGAHYYGATTDVTRTIAVGQASLQQKEMYTCVLKGHLALANINFPIGSSGANLDAIARQYLWANGLDYPHATGHGVGNAINVHEGPHAISNNNDVSLCANMIVSNEPGFYIEGSYGIRIENLMYVAAGAHENFLCLRHLTLLPYDEALINKDMLTEQEIMWIKGYYSKIDDEVAPLLSFEARLWLKRQLEWILAQ